MTQEINRRALSTPLNLSTNPRMNTPRQLGQTCPDCDLRSMNQHRRRRFNFTLRPDDNNWPTTTNMHHDMINIQSQNIRTGGCTHAPNRPSARSGLEGDESLLSTYVPQQVHLSIGVGNYQRVSFCFN